MKLKFIKFNKVFFLPEPDGPIINILNGQSLCSEEFFFLLLTILSKFHILYIQKTQLCCIFNLSILTKILSII